MATLEELEARIQKLEDIKAVERLQAEYWDLMDAKDWVGFRKCVTDDFVFRNMTTGGVYEGAETMVKIISGKFGPKVISSHHGHHHWVEITGPDTAIAHWALEDDLYDSEHGGEFVGRAHYDNKYVKIDGRWYCKEMALTYLRGEGQLKKILTDSSAAYKVFMM